MLEGPVLFFDGDCHLCNESVRVVLKLDRRRIFHFAPLQGETAEKIFTAAGISRSTLPDSLVLYDGKKIYVTFQALLHLARLLWPRIVPLWIILSLRPFSWIGEAGYRLIAAIRYKVFGRTEYCSVGRRGDRELFLP